MVERQGGTLNTTIEQLHSWGMINRFVHSGLQIDIVRVPQEVNGAVHDGHLCDHNCTIYAPKTSGFVTIEGTTKHTVAMLPTGGNYVCPSSVSLNRHLKSGAFAPAEVTVDWIKTAVAGLLLTRQNFLSEDFHGYCAEFKIPSATANEIWHGIADPKKKVEVNLFGGNPEMQNQLPTIIAEVKSFGNTIVNVTTTGRRFLRDENFVAAIESHAPNLIALSFDDLPAKELARLGTIPLSQVADEWRTCMRDNPNHGQHLKALEAVYTARLVSEFKQPIVTLFNMVMHPGNLGEFKEIREIIADLFPSSRANPYNAQDSFSHGEVRYDGETLLKFEELNDYLILRTLDGDKNLSMRLHYYLFMKAIFDTWRHDPATLSRWISGYEGWQCFRRFGAARYLQIGGSPQPWPESKKYPGGHLGCFWNDQTITDPVQLNGQPSRIRDYLLGDLQSYALTKQGSGSACPGCVMPRLMFDMVSTETGMHEHLIRPYLALRKEYAGF